LQDLLAGKLKQSQGNLSITSSKTLYYLLHCEVSPKITEMDTKWLCEPGERSNIYKIQNFKDFSQIYLYFVLNAAPVLQN